MEHYNRYDTVSSIYIIFFLICSITFNQVNGSDELRPSDHGLEYQESATPTRDDVPGMLSFFNGKTTAPLPIAKNLTAASTWWRNDGSDGRSRREFNKGDRVRMILIISSLVCGLVGIIMLITSAIVLMVRYRKQKMKERSSSLPSLSLSPAPLTSVSNAGVKVDVL